MTELENKYLSGFLKAGKSQKLVEYSINFIRDELEINDFSIMQHRRHPDPYKLVYSSESKMNLEFIQDEIFSLGKHLLNNREVSGEQYNYFFMDSIDRNGTGEFYLSEQPFTNDIKNILQLWNKQNNILQSMVINNEIEINEVQATLTSQLMHDVQAIINLISSTERSTQLEKRIEYQKKVNKNYLFWIRECDILKTGVGLKELLESSLQITGIDLDKVEMKLPRDAMELSVDVELFAMAFNEIVLNAIEAIVENNFPKIKIKAHQCPSISPFFRKTWTIIEVEDKGAGISKDFIPFIFNPFFTTKKEEGCSGFGLANAKKIIEAHEGCIEIDSLPDNGTTVKLMIPG